MTQDVSVTPEPPRRSPDRAGAVAIVASAGGIAALISMLSSLPITFPLPIFVAQHLRRGHSVLDSILYWRCALSVIWALDGAQPLQGHVYLAPPGMRLSVTADGLEVSPLAPASSSWLASGDHLMHSLVALYGSRSIGFALSGAMPAGVNGLRAIKACGGFAIAQDRTSSESFELPSAGIDFAKAEIVMPPMRMASVLEIIAERWQTAAHRSMAQGRLLDATDRDPASRHERRCAARLADNRFRLWSGIGHTLANLARSVKRQNRKLVRVTKSA